MSANSTNPARIASLDQFRGYTVAGMFVVNFLGSFAACPRLFRHTNDYCSYADTIMPQFLLAVGFAFRLTFERRVQREGAAAAYSRVIRRILGLAAIAFGVYVLLPAAIDWRKVLESQPRELVVTILKRDWFQTLLHIAVTSLWILPVIRSSALVRIGFATASAALHIGISAWFYFEWVNTPPNGIDGGPLGFLTWTIPAITGTLACDMITATARRSPIGRMLGAAAGLMLAGWLISCGTRLYDVPPGTERPLAAKDSKLSASPVIPPRLNWEGRQWTELLAEPPFVRPPTAKHRQWNYWMMSQRAGTLSYLTFSAGVSMAVFALFYIACDVLGWQSQLFHTLGVNALAGYVIHDPVSNVVKAYVSRQSPALGMWTAFAIYFTIVWACLKLMQRRGVFFRL